MSIIDRAALQGYKWQYLIIDEGQRIKNASCRLVRELKKLPSENRLLLSGTPIQNTLEELWSLLNFVNPQIFDDLSVRDWRCLCLPGPVTMVSHNGMVSLASNAKKTCASLPKYSRAQISAFYPHTGHVHWSDLHVMVHNPPRPLPPSKELNCLFDKPSPSSCRDDIERQSFVHRAFDVAFPRRGRRIPLVKKPWMTCTRRSGSRASHPLSTVLLLE